MRIAIRSDSSLEIGTGHMSRCLALAAVLQRRGAKVEFICQDLPGNLMGEALKRGHAVHCLSGEGSEECVRLLKSIPRFDAFVLDRYGFDAQWERPIRPLVGRFLVIDDLADRPHDCDVLVDANFGPDYINRYDRLVPSNCQLLLGPSYALLRAQFSDLRAEAETIRMTPARIERLLVFFGGIDITNETSKTLEALHGLRRSDLYVDVVLGLNNPHRRAIEERLREHSNLRLHVQAENMAELMLSAQLALGAGGTASWERLSLGLPSIVISVASNQTQACLNLAKAGYHFFLGEAHHVSLESIQVAIAERISLAQETRSCGLNGMRLVDGLGCKRVSEVLTN